MNAIPTPLIMLGTGGDYVSRYFVRGTSLAKEAGNRLGQSLGQQPDTETAGGFAGYHHQRQQADYADPAQAGSTQRGSDAFEHADQPLSPTYSPATIKARANGAGAMAHGPEVSAASTSGAVATAAEAWLAAQHRTLVAIPLFAPPQPVAAPQAPAPQSIESVKPARSRSIPLLPATESRNTPQPVAYRTAIAAWPRIAAAVALPVLNSWLTPAELTAKSTATPESTYEPHAQAAPHPHPHPRPAPGPGLLADHAGAGRRIGRQQGDRLRARRGAHQKGSALARSQQGSLFNG